MTAVTGRPVSTILRVRGWLRICTPLHVGGQARDPNGELSVAVDGLGRFYVPGSGLAGAFRAWTEAHTPAEPQPTHGSYRPLWGYAQQHGQDGSASRAVVYDALITTGTACSADGWPTEPLHPSRVESRTSVGIDRRTGTAAEGFLHARMVIPRGAYLRLELDVESTADQWDLDRRRIGVLLDSLGAGDIRLGAAKTRGLGRVELAGTGLTILADDLSSKDGLLALLTGQTRELTRSDLGDGWPATGTTLTVQVDWQPVGPTMVRAAADGTVADSVPLTSGTGSRTVRLVLPGSSVKGALRARAEWIERTVRRLDAPRPDTDDPVGRRSAFRAQLGQPDLLAVQALFGTAATGSADDDEADRGGVAALAVDDCYALEDLDRAEWQAIFGAGQAEPPTPDWLADRHLAVADHVAIDRWTGGAADGRLYSVLEPLGMSWEPIRMTMDLTRLAASLGGKDRAAVALFVLLLRDLSGGHVPIGYGTNRGFGDIRVTRILVTGGDWPDGTEVADLLTSDPVRQLSDAWQRYLDEEDPS